MNITDQTLMQHDGRQRQRPHHTDGTGRHVLNIRLNTKTKKNSQNKFNKQMLKISLNQSRRDTHS